MPCIHSDVTRDRAARRQWLAVAVGLLAIASIARSGVAQQPSTASAAAGAEYRGPTLTMVQPAPGAAVPIDRPIIVFRYVPGSAADPVDARSFAVTVDGESRSALFQVTATEAWGPMVSTVEGAQSAIALGPHQIAARICSVRGACSEIAATVNVIQSAAAGGAHTTTDRRRSVIDLLLAAARKLLEP